MQQDFGNNLVIYAPACDNTERYLPKGCEVSSFSRFSQLKRYLRSNEAALVLVITSDNANEEVRQISRYLREGLANYATRIIVLTDIDQQHYELQWLNDYAIDAVYPTDTDAELLFARLSQHLSSYKALRNRLQQSETQTGLLLSVTQFSQARSSFSDLIAQFATALSGFCFATSSFVVRKPKGANLSLEQISGSTLDPVHLPSITTGPLARIIETSFKLSTPQLELVTQDAQIGELQRLQIDSSSYVSFPIVVYDKVIAVVLCFISSNAMDAVSVRQIDIMKEAASQLRNLLERRTAESRMKSQYQRLKSALLELQGTQDQLIQSEKMASVGQLAAGIAHEVNNPMSFVLSNFSSMDDYVRTMIKMLELHDEFVNAIQDAESTQHCDAKARDLKASIEEFQQSKDLDFILEDIWEIVNESRQGLLRVRDIVSDLQSFCHKQELETTDVDLNSLIQESLRMLKHQTMGNITITTDISIDAPIHAHRGFLQQILVNLIVNATHAMEEIDRPVQDKQLVISATHDVNGTVLKVRDNGPGIPEKVRKKIFEPFFTTKEIGKGTGLGLSVSYNLIQKMQGSIEVDSADNQFTQFTITLPLCGEQETSNT